MFHPKPLQVDPHNPLVVVHDETQPCPYIDGRDARMPLQWPMMTMTADMLDRHLAEGYRRSGPFLYRTLCAKCNACEPTRVDVETFHWTKSFRRVIKRGDRDLEMRIAAPSVDAARIELFNKHRGAQGLGVDGRGTMEMDYHEYHGFLVDSICDTQELSFWKDGELIAIATTDFGRESMSLVYCFFDPKYGRYSPGSYSILKHFELAKQTKRRFVYLGMYVANNEHLRYKARYLPQERLRDGCWEHFYSPASASPPATVNLAGNANAC